MFNTNFQDILMKYRLITRFCIIKSLVSLWAGFCQETHSDLYLRGKMLNPMSIQQLLAINHLQTKSILQYGNGYEEQTLMRPLKYTFANCHSFTNSVSI